MGKNIFLIGIALSYIVLGIAQLFSDYIFPQSLYLTVTIVTFTLTLNELGKQLYNTYVKILKLNNETFHKFIKVVDEKIPFMDDEFKDTKYELLTYKENAKAYLAKNDKLWENQSIYKNIYTLVDIITVMSLIIIPFLEIENTLFLEKSILFLTLLSFAMIFIAMLLKDYDAKCEDECSKYIPILTQMLRNIKFTEVETDVNINQGN